MLEYIAVARRVLTQGTRKENRTGVDTLSTFNVNYEVDLRRGFPLLTTKEIAWKNIVAENLWFLSGQRDIGLLRRHGCRFWDAWADKQGNVPSPYGNIWRNFPVHSTRDSSDIRVDGDPCLGWLDQVSAVIKELKRNPMSRRLVVSAWDPANALSSKLPPCHFAWVLNVQSERDGGRTLNMHLTQRSCDVALGLPYNLAGYALLLTLFAQFSGLTPGRFAHTLVDAHVYTSKPDGSMPDHDHVPGLWQQCLRPLKPLPTLEIDPALKSLEDLEPLYSADTKTILKAFQLRDYHPHPEIRFKVAV